MGYSDCDDNLFAGKILLANTKSNTSGTNRVSKIVQNSEAQILLIIETSKPKPLYVLDCLNHCFEGLTLIGARLE